MASGRDELETVTEDLGYLGNCGANLKARFKSGIDMNTFFKTGTARFEVDTNDTGRFIDDEEEENFIDEDSRKYFEQSRLYLEDAKATEVKQSLHLFDNPRFESFYDGSEKLETIANGKVKKLIIKEGSGEFVPENCKVYVHYVFIAKGIDDPFDSTIMGGNPIRIDLRNNDILPGLYFVLKSMRVLEVSKFLINYELAFGAIGCPPRIPPATDMHCIVQVLAVIDKQKLDSIPYMSQDERAVLVFKQIYDASIKLRMEGNGFYANKNYWNAIKKYRKGAGILEDYPVISNEDNSSRQELLYTIYCNVAQCYLKVNRPQQACIACQLGFRCKDRMDSSCSKLFYRFAEAKLLLGRTDDALRLCKEALCRDPTNTAIIEQKQKILRKHEEDKCISKAIFTKMGKSFQTSSNSGNSKKTQENTLVTEVNSDASGPRKMSDKNELSIHEPDPATRRVVNNPKFESKRSTKLNSQNQLEIKETEPSTSSISTVVENEEQSPPPVDWEEFQEYMEAKERK